MKQNKLLRMDNVGIVVEDLDAAVAFFTELGMELEASMPVEGAWVDRIVGLQGVRNNIAMMRTPDGHGKLELMKFLNPAPAPRGPDAPVNTMGLRRIMFAVDGLQDVISRLRQHGASPMGDIVLFEDVNGNGYRLCYLRGPEGIIIALAEKLGNNEDTDSGEPKLLGMDNVLIVVKDPETAKAFFMELGLEYQGEASVGGPRVDRLIGLKDTQATLYMLRTPDGHSGIELDKFHSPPATGTETGVTPVNTAGIRRLMFAVTDIRETVARLKKHGAALIGEVTQYEDMYLLCYLRGPEGIIVALAERLGN